MTTYCTYEMKGIKSEFADWVSNISPDYTPFISMLQKFPVKNTLFHWQVDSLTAVNTDNAFEEGSDASSVAITPTTVQNNYTQIMRKVVMVSDTANAVASYGREKELFYQLKKAAKALKRDNEAIFLQKAQDKKAASSSAAGETASFGKQIDASLQLTLKKSEFEKNLFEATEKLYTEGSEANIIMYHPALADLFAALQEAAAPGNRQRIFKNDKRFVKEVNHLVDPLGQEYMLIPNRWCPENVAYVFSAADVSMAVLRAPQQVELSKSGSSQKWMIEQEVGLRLSNPKAAAMLTYDSAA